ncbi:SDR family NAD(P)-dependent oxidoreductase [Rhodococcus sp. G-MC3]|uniref:SDR family NAD(P)-dependent oxidoreductase n=1 Tax=Rhodococcus sp. G-MC3 TaxID=3046209 RepID=UPI0024B94A1B|nr:SDR family NAD(P)-dependent oxidoreductase [Rhodococcus sp. G-MC3]MDJ0392658.1 SDR family NAD(P)-dependent oxidoreductase [Rhodococcus sp. G-MC3]
MTKPNPKLVVVIGANNPVGRAIALRYARIGATVIAAATSARDPRTSAQMDTEPVHTQDVDVADPSAVAAFAARVHTEHGVPDLVVTCATVQLTGRFVDHTTSDWEQLFRINILGVIECCKVFAEQMVNDQNRGQIVNVVSSGAYVPIPLSTPFSASMSAVLIASECLRAELSPHRIGVTAVCPGFANTTFDTSISNLDHGTADFYSTEPDAVAATVVHAAKANPAIAFADSQARNDYWQSLRSPAATRRRVARHNGYGHDSKPAQRGKDRRLVFITGAGSGIGRAAALRFAAEGAAVIVTDIDPTTAQQTVELIRARGGTAFPYVLDVSDAAAFESLAAQVRDVHGVPDVVVNNAGMGYGGTVLEHSYRDWERMLGVHLMGVVYGSTFFAAQMIDRGEGGHIVNTASVAAFGALPLASSYCAAKNAIKIVSDGLRMELAPHGIGVSTMCYGLINTNLVTDAVLLNTDPYLSTTARSIGTRVMRMLGCDPDVAARAIIRAADRDLAVVPVRPEAWVSYGLSRLFPGPSRRLLGLATRRNVDRLERALPDRLLRTPAAPAQPSRRRSP